MTSPTACYAHTHVERARLCVGNDMFQRGRVPFTNAFFFCMQGRFEEGEPDALRALAIFERLGATDSTEKTRLIFGGINRSTRGNGLDGDGSLSKFWPPVLLPQRICKNLLPVARLCFRTLSQWPDPVKYENMTPFLIPLLLHCSFLFMHQ